MSIFAKNLCMHNYLSIFIQFHGLNLQTRYRRNGGSQASPGLEIYLLPVFTKFGKSKSYKAEIVELSVTNGKIFCHFAGFGAYGNMGNGRGGPLGEESQFPSLITTGLFYKQVLVFILLSITP